MTTIWKSLMKVAAEAVQKQSQPVSTQQPANGAQTPQAKAPGNANYTEFGGRWGGYANAAVQSFKEAEQLQQKKDLGKFLGTMLASEKERQYVDNRPNPISGLSTTGLESYLQQTQTYKQPTNIPVTPNTPQVRPGNWLKYYTKPRFYAGQNPYQLV